MIIVEFEEAMKMAAGENYGDIYVMQPTAIRYMNIREIHVAVKKGQSLQLWSRRTSVSRLIMITHSEMQKGNLVFLDLDGTKIIICTLLMRKAQMERRDFLPSIREKKRMLAHTQTTHGSNPKIQQCTTGRRL